MFDGVKLAPSCDSQHDKANARGNSKARTDIAMKASNRAWVTTNLGFVMMRPGDWKRPGVPPSSQATRPPTDKAPAEHPW